MSKLKLRCVQVRDLAQQTHLAIRGRRSRTLCERVHLAGTRATLKPTLPLCEGCEGAADSRGLDIPAGIPRRG